MAIPTCNYKLDNQEYYVHTIKNNEYVPYVYGFVISITSIGLLTSIYNANVEYKNKLKNKIKLSFFIILILIFLGLLGYSAYEIANFNTKNISTTYSPNEILRPCYSKYDKKIYGLTEDVIINNIKARSSKINDKISEEDNANEEDKIINMDEKFIIRYVSLDRKYYPNYNDIKSYSSNSPDLKISVESNKQTKNVPNKQTKNVPSEEKTISDPYNTRSSNTSSDISGYVTPSYSSVDGSVDASVDATGTSTSVLGSRVGITNNSAPPVSTISETNNMELQQNESGTSSNQVIGSTILAPDGSIRVTGS
jgi:hypothetical protein